MTDGRRAQLLRRIGARLRVVGFASRYRILFLYAAAAYLILLLIARLTGLAPGFLNFRSLVAIPALAILAALIWRRKITTADAARRIDAHQATQDLFLTTVLLESAAGDYKPLVLEAAETRANQIAAPAIVPYRWQRGTASVCGMFALVAFCVWTLPQLDPFGLQKRRLEMAQQQERARELNKATALRAAALQRQTDGPLTEPIKQAIADLETKLKQAKPGQPAANLARLNDSQKRLGELWKGLSEEKLKNAMNSPASQKFGLGEQSEKIKNDLQKGDVSSAKQELEELRQKAKELAGTSDPIEREKLRQEIINRLQNLSDTLARELNSQPMNAALARALEQLQLANLKEQSSESLQDLADSLQLSEMELDQLAKAMRDLKQLEEALKTLQMARRLCNAGSLDGNQCEGFDAMAQYAALYESLLKKCTVPGVGMGEGLGTGPRPTEDESVRTAMRPAQDTAPLQPGQILMQWKTREVSDPGQAREEFQRALADVKQRASEAVVQEQVPPGYHAAIQKYFDSLSEQTVKP